jgi:hypothetical protein
MATVIRRAPVAGGLALGLAAAAVAVAVAVAPEPVPMACAGALFLEGPALTLGTAVAADVGLSHMPILD